VFDFVCHTDINEITYIDPALSEQKQRTESFTCPTTLHTLQKQSTEHTYLR